MAPSFEEYADAAEIDEPNLLARLIHEVLEQTAWQADAHTLIDRVGRLNLGLPAEDEFSVLLAWLGKCHLVHKLDQLQTPPESKDRFQVPDLLAVLEYEGRSLPVLIEVKSKRTKKLSWTSSYYEGLAKYGQTLGLPVLVAWKREQVWSLFELRHLKLARTNYNVSFETAQKQNLLGILAGDFVIVLRGGVGFHFTVRKEKLVRVGELVDGPNELWQARIEKAHFTNGDGAQLKRLGSGLWSLFLTSPVVETSEVTESSISCSFEVPDEEPIQWAHGVFSNLLKLRGKDKGSIHWRQVLRKYSIPTESAVLREGAKEGSDTGIVRYVIDQIPQEPPDFLNVNTATSQFYEKLR